MDFGAPVTSTARPDTEHRLGHFHGPHGELPSLGVGLQTKVHPRTGHEGLYDEALIGVLAAGVEGEAEESNGRAKLVHLQVGARDAHLRNLWKKIHT